MEINFIETSWTALSPFSAHEVEVDGVVYKTAEHAYQTLRMIEAGREKIQNASSPIKAWQLAQVAKEAGLLDIAIDKYALMEKIFRAKLTHHDDVQAILRATGNATLLKVWDTDYYWGTGADGTGENQMGKIWMKLRDEIQ